MEFWLLTPLLFASGYLPGRQKVGTGANGTVDVKNPTTLVTGWG